MRRILNQEEPAKTTPETSKKPVIGRIKNVDLSKISKKMQVILENEINLIFVESRAGSIGEISHKKFLNYLKFLPELRKAEDEDLENLTDEELEELTKKTQK